LCRLHKAKDFRLLFFDSIKPPVEMIGQIFEARAHGVTFGDDILNHVLKIVGAYAEALHDNSGNVHVA